MAVFNYDVFISYKSEEESWAKRLAKTLRDFGLKVWRDHDPGNGIPVARVWSDEIKNAIRSSEKMIVLWSNLLLTNAASVVHEEINEMATLVNNDQTGSRNLIPVSLDGTLTANYQNLKALQSDNSFQNLYQKYGAAGADDVKTMEWYSAVKTLIETLGIKDVMEVRFVVAAMNRAQAIELRDDPTVYSQDGNILTKMLAVMNRTSPFNVDRYGNSPDEWKPFPQLNASIKDIIEQYDADKRDHYQSNNDFAKWIVVSYSEEMFSADAAVRANARNSIDNKPCLVIVDPVSLMHRRIYNSILQSGLQNHPKAFFMGIAPFVSQMHQDLYNLSNDLETELEQYMQAAYDRFKKYFEPVNQTCVLGVDHEYQFMRWLQVAADNIVKFGETPLRPQPRKTNPARFQRLAIEAGSQPGADVIKMGGGD